MKEYIRVFIDFFFLFNLTIAYIQYVKNLYRYIYIYSLLDNILSLSYQEEYLDKREYYQIGILALRDHVKEQ